MNPEQFTHYLYGFSKVLNGSTPTKAQWEDICQELDKVFNKQTPDRFNMVPGSGPSLPLKGKFLSTC